MCTLQMITIEVCRNMVTAHGVEEWSMDPQQLHCPSMILERRHYSTYPISPCSFLCPSTMLALKHKQFVQLSTKLLEPFSPRAAIFLTLLNQNGGSFKWKKTICSNTSKYSIIPYPLIKCVCRAMAESSTALRPLKRD